MIVSKIASAIMNDVLSGLQGYTATLNISLEQLEDEVVEERLYIIKQHSLKNLVPRKDLMYSLNCIEVDCKSLDKCCNDEGYSKPMAHFEIPQIVTDLGDQAIEFLGTVDKQIKFKVYTSPNTFKYHKYRNRRVDKPYVYIDTTPNENNNYDCYLFNAPLLERVSIIAIFKDPRVVAKMSCCNFTDADNLTWIATEVKKNLTEKKLYYYRKLYPAVTNPDVQVNDQTPK